MNYLLLARAVSKTITLIQWRVLKAIPGRAVARSENLGGHIVLGGDNVPPPVEIGLTDLSKSVGGGAVPPSFCQIR